MKLLESSPESPDPVQEEFCGHTKYRESQSQLIADDQGKDAQPDCHDRYHCNMKTCQAAHHANKWLTTPSKLLDKYYM